MLETLFTGVIPLVLLLFLAFFITVSLHELGHAIPALLMTRRRVTIYIGSLGSPYQSFHVSVGRLTFFCKYNPLLWYKGCCVTNYDLSIDQQILYVAGGPIASFLGTLASWFLVLAMEHQDFFRVVAGSIFALSLLVTISIVFPSARVRYTASGHPVHNDTVQLFRLIRMKYG